MLRMSKLPLEGIRVIDSSYVFAGPYSTGLLGDMGAEVIKVEGPSRTDMTRGGAFSGMMPDNDKGDDYWNRTSTYNLVNRGKKSLVLDLSKPEGREIFLDLITKSDILLENFTPRVMRGWGMDYPKLKEKHPGLIMISNTGYGRGGPYSDYPAQATTQEATHGLAAVTGYRGGDPSKAGQSFVDFLAAWACMTAALLGLRFRRHHGRGLWADIGMYQMGCYNVSEFVLDSIANGAPGERIGNRHRQFAPQGTYRCSGRDEWVTLCVRDDHEWTALCDLIGQPGLAADPRYATVKARHENHDAIDEIITRWTKTVGKMEAMERIQGVGVPAGAVLENRDLHFNPQIAARGLLEWIDFPPERKMGPRRRVIGRPWQFSRAPMQVRGPAPVFGQDNRHIMRDILGYDDAKIEALARLEAFADQPRKTRETPDVSMDDRVKLGRLAYWEPDYHKQLGM